ncbi:hypothetical protein A3850_003360 [Lewinella sp. 4G2]|nr:hypothetical protein A3850_003360 [Lewinella sp. 4G2]
MFLGAALVFAGAICKIQSWEVSPWVLPAGVLLGLLGTIGFVFNALRRPEVTKVEPTLMLRDLPEKEATPQARPAADDQLV